MIAPDSNIFTPGARAQITRLTVLNENSMNVVLQNGMTFVVSKDTKTDFKTTQGYTRYGPLVAAAPQPQVTYHATNNPWEGGRGGGGGDEAKGRRHAPARGSPSPPPVRTRLGVHGGGTGELMCGALWCILHFGAL